MNVRRIAAPVLSFSGTGMKIAELTLAQAAVFAFPLVFAVVCARNLGPANYGVVAFYTALAAFLGTFIDFGSDSIGVREVHATTRSHKPEQVMWSVTLVKFIVCLLTCIVCVPVLLVTRSSTEHSMSYAMLAYLVAYAFDTSWYLRSLELMRSIMLLSATSRLAGIGLLLCVVIGQHDMAAAMWTYAFVAWANAVMCWVVMFRSRVLGKPRIDVPYLVSLFRGGASIVVGNLCGNSITSGGIALLGVLADPVLTGAANIALRIRTAGQGMLLPVTQLGFVRLSTRMASDRRAAVALGRRLFYALMALSFTIALLIIVYADWIAALAYGLPVAPEPAGVLVRVFAVTIPASVAGVLFGMQSLTLFNRERAYGFVLLGAATIFFALLLFTSAGRSASYSWAFLAAEVWTLLVAGLYLRHVVKRA